MMMQSEGYTENDWKLFRSRIAGWQNAYIDKLNKEYIELLSAEGDASDKFWKLEKRIRGDKRKKGVVLEMKRSALVWNMIGLIDEGVIGPDDLEGFSDELKERVEYVLAISRKSEVIESEDI